MPFLPQVGDGCEVVEAASGQGQAAGRSGTRTGLFTFWHKLKVYVLLFVSTLLMSSHRKLRKCKHLPGEYACWGGLNRDSVNSAEAK